ncbi:MAG: hypothetical protein QHH10_08385 [Peptococcaceae bacterium]|jgi:ATP/ADP translocase|nr:hypothetical protein [Peptococcaceae bacterium]MDH7525312.1 hypothetical protein [Peptococcaceae bacterium]
MERFLAAFLLVLIGGAVFYLLIAYVILPVIKLFQQQSRLKK